MTTIEYLECLKPDYRKRAISQMNPERKNDPCSSIFKAICHFQSWERTEEKHEFWALVAGGVMHLQEQYVDRVKLNELYAKHNKI